MMPLARPDLAVKHLRLVGLSTRGGDGPEVIALLIRQAASISPDDGEIAFNLGAVLEAGEFHCVSVAQTLPLSLSL